MNKGPQGKTQMGSRGKGLLYDLDDESVNDSSSISSSQEKANTPEEPRLRGQVYLEGIGWVHHSQVPNGPLHDFGADVFAEMFGDPDDETECASSSEESDVEYISAKEAICEMFTQIKNQGKSFFESLKNINLFGPKYVTEEEDASSSKRIFK